MKTNPYFKFWLPVFMVHFLHQVEESISFFPWYNEFIVHAPKFLRILKPEFSNLAVQHPEYFIAASFAQFVFVGLFVFLLRKNPKATKTCVLIYIGALNFFLIWHIAISYFTHSYSPVLITCFLGVYLTPFWLLKIFKANNIHNN